MVLIASAAFAADPCFVDLAPVANTAIEDDGIADNGQGGWTDEGVNDMYMFPPVQTGRVTRNGYTFMLPPAGQGLPSVVMLKGASRAKDKPESVSVTVPSVKARYLYVLQNAAAQVQPAPAGYTVATYTVTYADGATQAIPVRDGQEIRQWWTGQWWDNAGRASWPFFMGRNLYSQKWNRFIGVWAMQWENPRPEVAISGLTFHSEGKAVPVIWAVTLADEDFYEPEDRRKQDFKRPDGPPATYFAAKSEQERHAVLDAAAREGLLTGVQRVDVIRPDLLAVSVDGAIGRIGPGDGAGVIERLQVPETFRISSASDAAWHEGLRPVKVGRHTCECWRGDIGSFPANTLFMHTFYLALPRPLQSGQTYRIEVGSLDARFTNAVTLAYDDAKTCTPVVKVNQGGYWSRASLRYAYLGWWAGDLGKVDYADRTTFEVIDEARGVPVLAGKIVLRKADDPASGEDVYELDLGGIKQDGRYHIRIPGLGRSDTFAVGRTALRGLYADTMRAFFHQRCGQELKAPWTTYSRPACHLRSYLSGHLVGNRSYVPAPDEPVRQFRGGYHDAGDDDCFAYHLRATAQTLSAWEHGRDVLGDGDLNIPESGNGIPDVLDEATWALSFYMDNQQEDGGILLGRGNDEDAIRDWEQKHKSRPPYGNFPPTTLSSAEFAATAALYARLIGPYDAARQKRALAAAQRAYDWTAAHPAEPAGEAGQLLFRAWAAAELFAATGAARYNDDLRQWVKDGAFTKVHWKLASLVPFCQWAYAACDREGTDSTIRDACRQSILRRADQVVSNTLAQTYRMGHDGKTALGWGNGNGGGFYADACLRAYWLTGQARYLDAASLNADFQLGANPLSKTFITGIGVRHPVQSEVNEALYTQPHRRGDAVRGITVYGLANGQPPGYPAAVPLLRRWRDVGTGAEVCSEFTITETFGATAMLYTSLYALEPR